MALCHTLNAGGTNTTSNQRVASYQPNSLNQYSFSAVLAAAELKPKFFFKRNWAIVASSPHYLATRLHRHPQRACPLHPQLQGVPRDACSIGTRGSRFSNCQRPQGSPRCSEAKRICPSRTRPSRASIATCAMGMRVFGESKSPCPQ